MENHKNHMFLKPLKAQTMWKTLEMIIAKRMQNMGQIENKNIIFVAKIHFDIFCIRWKIMGGSGSRFSTRPKGGCLNPQPAIYVSPSLHPQPAYGGFR